MKIVPVLAILFAMTFIGCKERPQVSGTNSEATQASVRSGLVIRDELTPFIQKYDALSEHTDAVHETLILENEKLHEREMGVAYYNSMTEEELARLPQIAKVFSGYLPKAVVFWRENLTVVKDIIGKTKEIYKSNFDIDLNSTIFLWSALAPTDGIAFKLDGNPAYALNFWRMGKLQRSQYEIIVSHEFFHTVQLSMGHTENAVGELLQSEGTATFVSLQVFPGQEKFKYVSYFMNDDSQYKEFQRLESEISKSMLQDLDSNDQSKMDKYFSGDSEASAPWPARAGYYIGLRIAEMLLNDHSARDISMMSYEQYKPLAISKLKVMIRID